MKQIKKTYDQLLNDNIKLLKILNEMKLILNRFSNDIYDYRIMNLKEFHYNHNK